jgi:hypothetical protein
MAGVAILKRPPDRVLKHGGIVPAVLKHHLGCECP